MPHLSATAAQRLAIAHIASPAPGGALSSAAARSLVDVRNTQAMPATRAPLSTLRHAIGSLFSCARGQDAPMADAHIADEVFGPGALEAWAQRGASAEQRAEAARRVLDYLRDPAAAGFALNLRNLGLRELPPLSPFLPATILDAFGNPLQRLPTRLPAVVSLWIDLDPSRFPPSRYKDVANTPPLDGVRHLEIGPPDPWRDPHILLHLAVAMWFPVELQCDVAAEWSQALRVDFAAPFAEFLKKLARAADRAGLAESRASFRAGVAAWLRALAEDEALRVKTFEACAEAGESCEDRALLTYLAMLRVEMIHALDGGWHDEDLRGMLQLARGTLRQEHLERIALGRIRALERAGTRVDEVEVLLAYLVRLRDKLDLPFTARAGSYTHVHLSKVTDADLLQARREVLARETQLEAALDAWPPWQRRLARWNPERFDAAEATLMQWIEDGTYDLRLETHLMDTMPALVRDDDARREAGLVVMAALQHEAYGPLTQALLAEHGWASADAALSRPAAP